MPSQSEIDEIFSSVASRYDLMNDIMSFGLHRLWKKGLCGKIRGNKRAKLLDVAGGTGDIASKIFRENRQLQATVCDINLDMLEVGRNKAIDSGNLELSWVCASAEDLPFPSNFFDYYTIAFGIRNIPDRQKALREAYRVLKPTGRFLCLEFSPPQAKGAFRTAYDLYSFLVIPTIGKLVTGNAEAYSYLVHSIRKFPSRENFHHELTESGFCNVACENVCAGIASLYSAWKV